MFVHQQMDIEEINLILKQEKKLEIVSDDKGQEIELDYALCIHVQDENKKQFSLLINHKNNQQDLHKAKVKAKYHKSLCHPNLAQYLDDFTIGDYYFIQIERISQCLFNWINKKESDKSIRELHYVELAIQMLEVTFYLNKNKCSLSLESTLSCFAFDQEMNIKLIHFVTPLAISVPQVKSSFELCKRRNQIFYYKKDILTMDNNCKIWHVMDQDLWAVGICLYYLSGATTVQVLNYISGTEPYQFSNNLGFQTNIILFTIICESNKLISISRIIGSFSIQKRKLEENGQQRETTFEDKNMNEGDSENINQIQRDFKDYQKVYKDMHEKNTQENSNEIVKELIEKYGFSDTLLYLQIKHSIHINDLDEAINLSERLNEMNPLSESAFFYLGIASELKGNPEDTIRYYEQSLTINPLNSYTYNRIGVLYLEIEPLKSFKYYKKAIDTNVNNGVAHFNLGIEYGNNKQSKNAVLAYKIATHTNNQEGDFFYNLACEYEDRSQFESAIRAQKQVINIDASDDNVTVLNILKKKL